MYWCICIIGLSIIYSWVIQSVLKWSWNIFVCSNRIQKNDWWAGLTRIKSDMIFVWHLIDISYPRPNVFDNNEIYLVGFHTTRWLDISFHTSCCRAAQRSRPLTQNSTGSVLLKLVRDNWEILIVIFLAIPIHCSLSWSNGSMRTDRRNYC